MILAGAALAAYQTADRILAPPPSPEDTIITCRGPLTIVLVHPGKRDHLDF